MTTSVLHTPLPTSADPIQAMRDANILYTLISDYLDSTPASAQAISQIRRVERHLGELHRREADAFAARHGRL